MRANSRSGEVLTLVLVGVAFGVAALWVDAYNRANERAEQVGGYVYTWDMVKEEPGKAIAYPVIGAAAGWGVGKLLDSGDGGGGSSRDNNIDIDAEGGVYVTVSGDSSVQTENRTDIREDNSRTDR